MSGPRPDEGVIRSVVTAVRLTPAEAEALDASRRSLSRSEYLRLLLLKDRRGS